MYPEIENISIFITTSLFLALVPGPDMLLVLHHALRHGSRAGLIALLGIASGAMVHLALVSFGAALLLKQIPGGEAALRLGGGVFLLWLSWKAARSGGELPLGSMALRTPAKAVIYREGVFTNLLNPKVALFLLAFLPAFIPWNSTNPGLSAALLGTLFFLVGFLVMALLALLAGRLKAWIERNPAIPGWQAKISALLFAAFGLSLLLG